MGVKSINGSTHGEIYARVHDAREKIIRESD